MAGLLWDDKDRSFLAQVIYHASQHGGAQAVEDFLWSLDSTIVYAIRSALQRAAEEKGLDGWWKKYLPEHKSQDEEGESSDEFCCD